MAKKKTDAIEAEPESIPSGSEVESETKGEMLPEDREEMLVRLRTTRTRLTRPHVFHPGQLVEWKQGLRNRRRPGYGQPAVVVKTIDPPVADTDTSPASPYFREPLNIVLGMLDHDGDFMLLHYDSRRFCPYNPAH